MKFLMIKSILRLLAASTSFVALLLMTNSAIAATSIDYTVNQVEPSVVSINVVSPSLQLIGNGNNNLVDHLGCSCAECTQEIEQTSSDLSIVQID